MNWLNPVLACWAVSLTLLSGLSAKRTIPKYGARVGVAFATAFMVLTVLVVVVPFVQLHGR